MSTARLWKFTVVFEYFNSYTFRFQKFDSNRPFEVDLDVTNKGDPRNVLISDHIGMSEVFKNFERAGKVSRRTATTLVSSEEQVRNEKLQTELNKLTEEAEGGNVNKLNKSLTPKSNMKWEDSVVS